MEIGRLNSLTYVEYAEPNYIYRAQFTPNDEYYSRQWHLPLTKIDRVWDDGSLTLLNDLSSVTVAVIDTGIVRYSTVHPDLTGIFRDEYDFISDSEKSLDGDGPDDDASDTGSSYHGTHLSGIIGALTNNFTGVAGVAGGNSDGLKVQVSMNTDELKSGASYLALIEITDSTSYTVPVNVVYKYVGDVYIVAWHLSSFPSSLPVAKDSPEIAAIAVTDYEKGYRYKLEGLGPGKYVVGASTDRDKDNYIFEALEEIFGFFPDLKYASIMDLKNGEHRSDVDFQVIDSKL